MNKKVLLIVAPVLLVALGFGQTPVLSGNTDQASVKGCLGGSDGNYTLAEDGTAQIFKITASTVDLKAHLGHDVELSGQKANVATSSGSSNNGVIVTGLNMISDHCATSTASTPAAADTTPATTASTSAAADTTPPTTATTSAAADTTPATTDTTPTATASTSADPANAPEIASARAPESTKQLPNTASLLPLFGLLGMGLLVTGLLSRRPRTA